MPNWSSTSYHVVGDEKELKSLYELMVELSEMTKPRVENGFGPNWLGCLVDALGEDWQNISCRDAFFDMNLDVYGLRFITETAWNPCNEVMDFLRRKFPSLVFYYYTEEPGFGIYATNDVTGDYFPDRYVVVLHSEGTELCTEYFENIEDAYAWISDGLEKPITNAEELKAYDEWLQEQNDAFFCNIHEIKIENYAN